jgi:hypothetical protein
VGESLPAAAPGLTGDELHAELPEGTRRQFLRTVLKEGAAKGLWCRGGTGKRGDPFRYWRAADSVPEVF